MAVNAKLRDAHVVGVQKLSSDEWAASAAVDGTTSTTFQDKVSVTFTPATPGDYFVVATAECRHDSVGDHMECQLDHGGTPIGVWQMTPTDAGEYRTFAVLTRLAELSGSQTIKIQFRRVTSAGTSYIRNARLWCFRADTFNNVGYAEEPTSQTQTATTLTDELVLTYNVTNAGDHLILGAAHTTGPNHATVRAEHALLVDGVIKVTDSVRSAGTGVTDMTSLLYAEVVHFATTGNKTVKFQQRRTSAVGGQISIFSRQSLAVFELATGGAGSRAVSLGQAFARSRVAYAG